MIDQVADKHWLLGLSVAILIDARSQSVYRSLSQFFSRVFFKRADHTVTTYSITGLISLAPEKFPRVDQPSVLQTSNGHVDAERALWFPPDSFLFVTFRLFFEGWRLCPLCRPE